MDKAEKKHEVVFVYNADSGALPLVKDSVHKIVQPSTYQCNLCAVTYNNLGFMKVDWKKFVENIGVKATFLHRDQFYKISKLEGLELPAVYEKKGTKFVKLISHREINKCKTLKELEDLVLDKLKTIL